MTHTTHTKSTTTPDFQQLSDDEAVSRIVELRRAILRLEQLRAKVASELSA